MQFILTNDLNRASLCLDKEGSLLIRGIPKNTALSSSFKLPYDFHVITQNIYEYLHRNKSLSEQYLRESTDPSDEIWIYRTVALLEDLFHISQQDSISSQRNKGKVETVIDVLDIISNEYFQVFPEGRTRSGLLKLPATRSDAKGINLGSVGREHFICSILPLQNIFESIEKELYNVARSFLKSSVEKENSYTFFVEKDVCITENIKRMATTTLINIILNKKPKEIDIINQTNTPLGSTLDIEDIIQLAIHGYVAELDDDEELVINPN